MKKTHSMLALLVCLALLVSLCAVTASAAETVNSNADFTALDVADAGDATKAAMESLGVTVPAGSDWHLVDHFYHVAIPKEGYQKTYYIQTLDAGKGKVLAKDANLELAYALAAEADDPAYTVGWVIVYVSTDGENYKEVWANDEGQGKMYDASAFAVDQIPLTGTAGASKIWIKVEVERHGGETSGAIGWSKISGTAKASNEINEYVDFTSLTPAAGGAESNAAMEALGITVPEGSDWQVVDHFGICIIPKEGYQKTYYIQTLDAGKGKVLSEDATLDLSYAMAALDDPSFLVVYVSTDGENYTEVWANEEGQGQMYDVSAFTEDKITLTGTAGASKIWVKVELERHSGETSGLIKTSTLSGLTKAAPGAKPDPSNPKAGDSISVFVAMAMVCAAGAVITTKKFRKEN